MAHFFFVHKFTFEEIALRDGTLQVAIQMIANVFLEKKA